MLNRGALWMEREAFEGYIMTYSPDTEHDSCGPWPRWRGRD